MLNLLSYVHWGNLRGNKKVMAMNCFNNLYEIFLLGLFAFVFFSFIFIKFQHIVNIKSIKMKIQELLKSGTGKKKHFV